MTKATTKTLDPKQSLFLQLYLTPGTSYFSNALQSGLKAGYTQEYSENILQEDLKWLKDGISEILGKPTDKKNLVAKAKKVLAESMDGKDKRLAQDTAKFVAKTDPEFSEKVDLIADINHRFEDLNDDDLEKAITARQNRLS